MLISALFYITTLRLRTQKFILALPIQIGTDLKSVQVDRSNNNFQQSSFSLGTGASMRYQVNRRVGAALCGLHPTLGLAFHKEISLAGACSEDWCQPDSILTMSLALQPLVFGYDFDYRDYDIEGIQNDYSYFNHIPLHSD